MQPRPGRHFAPSAGELYAQVELARGGQPFQTRNATKDGAVPSSRKAAAAEAERGRRVPCRASGDGQSR